MKKALLLAAGLFCSASTLAAASQPFPPPSDQSPARNLAQENRNLQLVYHFYNQFFNDHELSAADRDLSAGYIQHNPHVPDGRAPFVHYFAGYFKANPHAHSVISQYATYGDRVFLRVHSVRNPDDRGRAIVDIFRVKDGKITEHWDSVQDVPATAANNNTMF
ncbi:nuclear transport factor 2 family protein [Tatumella ptyseos]|uniref:nuclear transport factor 2 family protein n=1 Tax=Tatumella ptyseos TaxID=82987 RepID=UPI0023F2AC3B|nr:nuclear transport factor 2 family protein [Tatumella ptyseos]